MRWLNNNSFVMGGIYWRVVMVPPDSVELIDRTGSLTVATTDPTNHTVYLAETLTGEFLAHVLIHELGHCAMVSFGLIDDLRRMVKPDYWVEMEEWVCNFLADYSYEIYCDAYRVLGVEALYLIPKELERLIA